MYKVISNTAAVCPLRLSKYSLGKSSLRIALTVIEEEEYQLVTAYFVELY